MERILEGAGFMGTFAKPSTTKDTKVHEGKSFARTRPSAPATLRALTGILLARRVFN